MKLIRNSDVIYIILMQIRLQDMAVRWLKNDIRGHYLVKLQVEPIWDDSYRKKRMEKILFWVGQIDFKSNRIRGTSPRLDI